MELRIVTLLIKIAESYNYVFWVISACFSLDSTTLPIGVLPIISQYRKLRIVKVFVHR